MSSSDRTPTMTALAVALPILMALRGWKRKSLTRSGAVAAWVVGFLSLWCGRRGFLLLLFYLVSVVVQRLPGPRCRWTSSAMADAPSGSALRRRPKEEGGEGPLRRAESVLLAAGSGGRVGGGLRSAALRRRRPATRVGSAERGKW